MKYIKNKEMLDGIISAALGGIFFAIPYLALDASILVSLGMGVVAFGAGNLVFSSKKSKDIKTSTNNLYDILNKAKNENAKIYSIINKVENMQLQKDIKQLHETASKIIDTISKNPDKLSKATSFFDYYLPVTLKILVKYDDIENQELDNEETLEFMKKTEDMISKIKKSFKVQLSNLYQSDIIDTDAEIKVFEQMLNADGFSNMNDFNIK